MRRPCYRTVTESEQATERQPGGIAAMHIRPAVVFAIIWLGWLLSWVAAAFWTNRTEKRVSTWDVWVSRALLLAGGLLLFHATRRLLQEPMLWHVGYGGGDALAALALLGIVFAW